MSRLFARLALLAAVIAAVLVAGAAPAYRYANIDLGLAFNALRFGVYAAMGAGALAVLWLIFAFIGRSSSGLGSVIVALVLAGLAAYFPLSWRATAKELPPIHDITTDTANPPVFVALKPAREASDNGLDYKTSPAAQQQAYADIQTLVTDVPIADMFARAEKVARDMGWEVVAAVPEEGRIEATDTTKWWGFKDDVVIRITTDGTATRVDVRSMSRVGKSDMGKNAARIREFLAKLKEAK